MPQTSHQQREPEIAGNIVPVILCGGSGSRLWPRSQPEAPKPFLPLIGDKSLFEQTLERCSGSGFAAPVVVTGAPHLELVQRQAGGHALREIIVEPTPKSTAAAIAYAAARLPGDALMLVCPSDHHINDCEAFSAAAMKGAALGRRGMLVCVTVTATDPDERFGYVCPAEALGDGSFRVGRFVEKPDRTTAESLIAAGAAWNAGIFAFTAAAYLQELALHRPAIARLAREAVAEGVLNDTRFTPHPGNVGQIVAEAVDYAVMEQTQRAAMVVADMGWSDVGNWRTVHALRAHDSAGNSVRGEAQLTDCVNVAVETDGPLVRCEGVENLAVIVANGQVLVRWIGGAARSGPSRSGSPKTSSFS